MLHLPSMFNSFVVSGYAVRTEARSFGMLRDQPAGPNHHSRVAMFKSLLGICDGPYQAETVFKSLKCWVHLNIMTPLAAQQHIGNCRAALQGLRAMSKAGSKQSQHQDAAKRMHPLTVQIVNLRNAAQTSSNGLCHTHYCIHTHMHAHGMPGSFEQQHLIQGFLFTFSRHTDRLSGFCVLR